MTTRIIPAIVPSSPTFETDNDIEKEAILELMEWAKLRENKGDSNASNELALLQADLKEVEDNITTADDQHKSDFQDYNQSKSTKRLFKPNPGTNQQKQEPPQPASKTAIHLEMVQRKLNQVQEENMILKAVQEVESVDSAKPTQKTVSHRTVKTRFGNRTVLTRDNVLRLQVHNEKDELQSKDSKSRQQSQQHQLRENEIALKQANRSLKEWNADLQKENASLNIQLVDMEQAVENMTRAVEYMTESMQSDCASKSLLNTKIAELGKSQLRDNVAWNQLTSELKQKSQNEMVLQKEVDRLRGEQLALTQSTESLYVLTQDLKMNNDALNEELRRSKEEENTAHELIRMQRQNAYKSVMNELTQNQHEAELQKELDHLRDEHHSLTQSTMKLYVLTQDLKMKNLSMKEELRQKNQNEEELRFELQILRDELQEMTQSTEKNVSMMEGLKEIKKENKSLQRECKSLKEDAENVFNDFLQTISDMKVKSVEIQRDSEEQKKYQQKLENHIQSLESTISDMKEENTENSSQLERKLYSVQVENQLLQTSNVPLKQSEATLNKMVKTLKQEMEEQTQQIERLQSIGATVQSRLSAASKSRDSLATQNEKLKEQIKKMKKLQIRNSNALRPVLLSSKSGTPVNGRKRWSEMVGGKKRNTEGGAKKSHSEEEKLKEELRERIQIESALSQEAATLKVELDSFRGRLKGSNQALSSMQAQVDALMEERDALRVELESSAAMNKELEDKMTVAQLHQLKRESTETQKSNDVSLNFMRSKNDELRARLIALEERMKLYQMEPDQLQQAFKALMHQNEELKLCIHKQSSSFRVGARGIETQNW